MCVYTYFYSRRTLCSNRPIYARVKYSTLTIYGSMCFDWVAIKSILKSQQLQKLQISSLQDIKTKQEHVMKHFCNHLPVNVFFTKKDCTFDGKNFTNRISTISLLGLTLLC